ncbi:MAG: hypothetical protein HC896_07110, partial [Bacteroidales bacterium]|nr:hypothetical protein [Bacteroidales bacterium]
VLAWAAHVVAAPVQNQPAYLSSKSFSLATGSADSVDVNQSFTGPGTFKLPAGLNNVYSLSVSGRVQLNAPNSMVRLILLDAGFNEHLLFETSTWLNGAGSFSFKNVCEETKSLAGIEPVEVKEL